MKNKIKQLRVPLPTLPPKSRIYLKRVFGKKQFPKRWKVLIEMEPVGLIRIEDAVAHLYREMRSSVKKSKTDSKELRVLHNLESFLLQHRYIISISGGRPQ